MVKKHASSWQTYVANCVSEIHKLLPEHQWRHVHFEDNSSDNVSRGRNASQLEKIPLWWKGPLWLQDSKDTWPANRIKLSSDTKL